MLPTAKQLERAVGIAPRLAEAITEPMREACRVFDITTGPRIAAFVAQCGHESASFMRLSENLNYSADGLLSTWPSRFTRDLAAQMARKPEAIANHVYGGRMGNSHPGDGWKYRGRGWIGNTGLANYEAITELVREKVPTAPDFALHPELLESHQWAAMAAGAFWDEKQLNALADTGQFDRITTRINGGQNGKADRRARYARAMRVFGA